MLLAVASIFLTALEPAVTKVCLPADQTMQPWLLHVNGCACCLAKTEGVTPCFLEVSSLQSYVLFGADALHTPTGRWLCLLAARARLLRDLSTWLLGCVKGPLIPPAPDSNQTRLLRPVVCLVAAACCLFVVAAAALTPAESPMPR